MDIKDITVAGIFYTCIKSTKGVWLTVPGASVSVGTRGIENDRRWLVVDDNGMFVAQRQSMPTGMPKIVEGLLTPLGLGIEVRRMCQIVSEIVGDELIISAPGMRYLYLPAEEISGRARMVQVWRDRDLPAIDCGMDATEWFTEFLSRERKGRYHLVRMAEGCGRLSKGGSAFQGFHDGFPFIFISQASLDHLNCLLGAKGEKPLPMNRFRPNIVLAGLSEHQEDHLARVTINGIRFNGKTLCDRCSVTCTDQEAAERGREPLTTLAAYRRGRDIGYPLKPNAVLFGRNFDHLDTGTIRVGDPVEVESLD